MPGVFFSLPVSHLIFICIFTEMAAAGLGRKLKHRLWGGVTDAIPKDGVRSVFTCQVPGVQAFLCGGEERVSGRRNAGKRQNVLMLVAGI